MVAIIVCVYSAVEVWGKCTSWKIHGSAGRSLLRLLEPKLPPILIARQAERQRASFSEKQGPLRQSNIPTSCHFTTLAKKPSMLQRLPIWSCHIVSMDH